MALKGPYPRDPTVRYIQIIDGDEVEMTDIGCHPKLKSDANHRVIFKVLGPSVEMYVLYINYDVVPT